jgi:hypothetical protein
MNSNQNDGKCIQNFKGRHFIVNEILHLRKIAVGFFPTNEASLLTKGCDIKTVTLHQRRLIAVVN